MVYAREKQYEEMNTCKMQTFIEKCVTMNQELRKDLLLYSLYEAAKMLNISPRTLWSMAQTDKALCVRIGSRRLFSRQWLTSKGVKLPPIQETNLINSKETARLLGISTKTLWTYFQNGIIPCNRIGTKSVRFSIAELQEWIAKEETR